MSLQGTFVLTSPTNVTIFTTFLYFVLQPSSSSDHGFDTLPFFKILSSSLPDLRSAVFSQIYEYRFSASSNYIKNIYLQIGK